MELAYIPGCALEGTARECDEATRAVFEALDLSLVDIDDWRCCGGTSLASVNRDAWVQANRHNLEKCAGRSDDVVVGCPICLRNLKDVARAVDAPSLVLPVEILARPENLEAIRQKKAPAKDTDEAQARPLLAGLSVVAYYGCQLAREETASVVAARPIEAVLEAVGTRAIPWESDVACCGGVIAHVADEGLARTERILAAAQDAGARAIVTACPLCHFNLDVRQDELTLKRHKLYRIPVFHLVELVGIALDIDDAEFWLARHMASAMELIFDLDRERAAAENT